MKISSSVQREIWVEQVSHEPLPSWLSAQQLLFWNLRAIERLGGQAHLDSIYTKLRQLLKIPDDLMQIEYQATRGRGGAEGYVARKQMQFALTDLGHLGHLNSLGQGYWSLTQKARHLLSVLDDDPEGLTERGWDRATGLQMTRLEKRLQNQLIDARRADHARRYPKDRSPRSSPPPATTQPPEGWPTGPITSSGAPKPRR